MKPLTSLLCIILVSVVSCGATHLRGGYIKAMKVPGTGSTFEITLTIFTDHHSPVKVGGDPDLSYIDFGDGTKHFVPEQVPVVRYDLDPNGYIGMVIYVTQHTYSGYSSHTISYSEPNRNAGIANCENSVNTLFSIQTLLINDPFLSPEGTPEPIAPPIFVGVLDSDFSASLAGTVPSDKTLYYQLVTPGSVVGYTIPENFKLNPYNGLITWDTRFHGNLQAGEYVFTVRIFQYQDNYLLGYTDVDFQVILMDVSDGGRLSDNVDTDENGRVFVSENSTFQFKIFAESSLSSQIGLALYTSLSDYAEFSTYDSLHETQKIKVGVVSLNNAPSITRNNPYAITVRAAFDISGQKIYKDKNYLFYTKDTEVPPFPVILSSDGNEFTKTVKVFPNPAQELLHVELPTIGNCTFKTVIGESIVTIREKEFIVDCRSWSAGIYILEASFENGSKTITRIVKAR